MFLPPVAGEEVGRREGDAAASAVLHRQRARPHRLPARACDIRLRRLVAVGRCDAHRHRREARRRTRIPGHLSGERVVLHLAGAAVAHDIGGTPGTGSGGYEAGDGSVALTVAGRPNDVGPRVAVGGVAPERGEHRDGAETLPRREVRRALVGQRVVPSDPRCVGLFGPDGAGIGGARDVVDDSAHRVAPVEAGAGSPHDLDALDILTREPGEAEIPVVGAVHGDTVHQDEGPLLALQSTQIDGAVSVVEHGRPVVVYAGRQRHRVVDARDAPRLKLRAADDGDGAGRVLESGLRSGRRDRDLVHLERRGGHLDHLRHLRTHLDAPGQVAERGDEYLGRTRRRNREAAVRRRFGDDALSVAPDHLHLRIRQRDTGLRVDDANLHLSRRRGDPAHQQAGQQRDTPPSRRA